jgi:hypothetical protein
MVIRILVICVALLVGFVMAYLLNQPGHVPAVQHTFGLTMLVSIALALYLLCSEGWERRVRMVHVRKG